MFIKKDSYLFSSTYLVKKIHKLPCSFLSITSSCKDFLYNLSEELLNCWSFPYCFLYLLYFFKIIWYSSLLAFDNPHAVAVDTGITIKPIPERLNIIALDVVAIITKVTNDFSIVVIVLYFLYFFFDVILLSLN